MTWVVLQLHSSHTITSPSWDLCHVIRCICLFSPLHTPSASLVEFLWSLLTSKGTYAFARRLLQKFTESCNTVDTGVRKMANFRLYKVSSHRFDVGRTAAIGAALFFLQSCSLELDNEINAIVLFGSTDLFAPTFHHCLQPHLQVPHPSKQWKKTSGTYRRLRLKWRAKFCKKGETGGSINLLGNTPKWLIDDSLGGEK